jgi:hypothetical protein
MGIRTSVMTCWFSHFESWRGGHDRKVADDSTGSELVREAAAQLYAGDPAGFIGRRGDLAARARASGDAAAAKQIAALRKPTRAAWVVNLLVRADPGAVSELAALGDDLRAAGRALDGRKLRELSQARRELITALTTRALAGAGLRDAPAAVQEEVTATLSAAVADPRVAADLAAGTLARPVERPGFGFGPAGDEGREEAPPEIPRTRPSGPARAERERAERVQAERERAERERRRELIAAAEQAVGRAGQAADAAQAAERARADAVHQLEQRLDDAQDKLAEAKRQARAAATALRDARRALDRLGRAGPPA